MQSNSPSVHFTAKENEAASSSMTRQSYNDDRERRPLAEDQLSSYYTFSAAAALLHRPEIDPRMFASEPISLAQPHGSNPSSGLALGTFRGVILPTCEFMWSVLIFIRFGWIVGSLGVAVAWALILLCAANVAITVSSLSAIATNGIPRGNVVHMLTKSLGSGLGGAITIPSHAFAISHFQVVGSTQGLLLSTNISLTGASIYWDQVLIAIASIITIVFIPPMVGKGVVLRLSMFFMVALTIAYLSLISGLVAAPSVMNYDGQVTGIRRETFAENFGPPGPEEFAWRETLVLMVPCFVGIFTGVNQAAHLKNPLVSIPLGSWIQRHIDLDDSLPLPNGLDRRLYPSQNPPGGSHSRSCFTMPNVHTGIAWPDPWFAKVGLYLVGQGSALHSTVIGAHVLQSLAAEEIVPGLKWLGLDIESQGIPRRGSTRFHLRPYMHNPSFIKLTIIFHSSFVTAITFMTLLTMPFLFFPDLDTIATVVTMIFLLCYGLTNFACFLLSVFHQPNWRPHFRYYHPLLSLAGSVLAVVLMFQIHGFVATLAILTLLLIAWSIQLQGATAWGYGIHGLLFHLVITHLTQAEREEFFQNLPKIDLSPTDHPRDSLAAHSITIGNARLSPQAGTVHVTTWRPHIVSFVPSSPSTRRGLLSIIAQLRTKSQLCVLADLVTTEEVDTAVGKRDQDGRGGKITIAGEGIKPFRRQEVLDELVVRRKTLLQRGMEEEGIQGFAKIVTCSSVRVAQSILMQSIGLGELTPNTVISEPTPVIHAWPSPTEDSDRNVESIRELQELWLLTRRQGLSTVLCKGLSSFPGISERVRGTLDIWWIGRDGQLLLLIATLLHQHPTYRECKIRLFSMGRVGEDLKELEKRIRVHLSLMRIRVDEVKSVPIQFAEPAPLSPVERLAEEALTHELEAETMEQYTFHRGDERLLNQFQTAWTPVYCA
ncbi:hypothetical protein BC938DRAFT_484097 [Jimgerdemannia flammicorona]|uniref:Amino acid permease-domain-containing protein n=1 Tax=Jimgerdemannia flammicorona TaxID=994334 RepID=A0A433QVG8_9FUNG|nr:hypothetical protein BC938DRAFT_484097 [Jimgerdemannia flammicorona]